MEQHPIPRQITTFEFKLIGFMTLKQFLYLLVFVPMGFVVFKLFPIPIVNIALALAVGGIGAALAFLPINDRPLDVWLKNLFRRLTSPTQYTFHKENSSLYFIENLYFLSDPHRVVSHIESKEKLAEYLQKTQPRQKVSNQKVHIQGLLRQTTTQMQGQNNAAPAVRPPQKIVLQSPLTAQNYLKTVSVPPETGTAQFSLPQQPVVTATVIPTPIQPAVARQALLHPFFTGTIKNNKKIPLPGILVYIKNQQQVPLRLLKTNPHGVFATYNPLPDGEYIFEIKDPNGGYFFDTMKIQVPNKENIPYDFSSKEMM